MPGSVASPRRNTADAGGVPVDPLARMLTPAELAAAWQLSEQTIRRLFQDRAGVLKLSNPSGRRKREYTTLRIPEAIAVAVFQDRSR